jgi:dTDP-D-glucose 4,6-dehydratase
LKIQIASFKIIFIVRLSDSNSILDFVHSLIKSRDVYNIKTQMRRENLEFMTSIQVLMHELDSNDWIYFFRKNRFNQVFISFSQKKVHSQFWKLIMRCWSKIVFIKQINTKCSWWSSSIKRHCIKRFTSRSALWRKKSKTTTCELWSN